MCSVDKPKAPPAPKVPEAESQTEVSEKSTNAREKQLEKQRAMVGRSGTLATGKAGLESQANTGKTVLGQIMPQANVVQASKKHKKQLQSGSEAVALREKFRNESLQNEGESGSGSIVTERNFTKATGFGSPGRRIDIVRGGNTNSGTRTGAYYANGKRYKNLDALYAAVDKGEVDGELIQRSVQDGGEFLEESGKASDADYKDRKGFNQAGTERFNEVADQYGKGRFSRKKQKGARPGRNAIVGGTNRRRQGSIATGQSGLSEDVTVARTILG